MEFTVSKLGKPLHPNLYDWDEKTLTFTSQQSHLVLDFTNWNNVRFETSTRCVFKTSDYCTFNTGSGCIFDTGHGCTFKTGGFCTFDTLNNCTFETGDGCTFKTGKCCTFKTGNRCIVTTRPESEIVILNNAINHYDASMNRPNFHGITVFKNGNDLNFGVNFQNFKLKTLRELFSDPDFYAKLEREIFEKMT